MAKNRQIKSTQAPAPAKGTVPKNTGTLRSERKSFIERYYNFLIPGAIAVLTWLFFKVCLSNQLTNWDDPGYVKDNPFIKDLSSEGIRNIFSWAHPIMGNYHPLTILTYAFDYSYRALDPWMYHLDSLLFHIAVTIAVYWLVLLLTRKPIAAGVTSLLFGLHPMHVESVAWVAGRKDVVYGLFYVLTCIAYLGYLRALGNKKWLLYGATLLLFVCSLLGKPVAVILPVTLLIVDYFEHRKLHYAMFIDKVPFFTLSVIFGMKSIADQHSFGSLNTLNVDYTYIERVALGGFAFITYLWKAVLPVKLLCFYPYPPKLSGSIPGIYYLYPLAALAIVGTVGWFFRRNRVVMFGSLFFVANIALLLQFIPVGGAILADRYSYIPYFGLFFIAGWYVASYFESGAEKGIRYAVVAGVLAYSLWLGYLCNERCQDWYDATTLWRDEIEKEPRDAPNAYNNLGFNYFNKFNESVNPNERKIYYDSAMSLLTRAIELQPSFANPYISLGELLRTDGKFTQAKASYYKALSLPASDEYANAYLGLGIIYAISRNFDSSGFCFRKAIELKPYFPEGHGNFGNFFDMTGKPDSALAHYALAIQQNPDMYAPHLNRGRLLMRMKRFDDAMKDLDEAAALSPNSGEIYYALAYCHAQKGNRAQAAQDVDKAIALGFKQVDPNFYQSLKGH